MDEKDVQNGQSGVRPSDSGTMTETERMFRTNMPLITEEDLKNFSGTVEIPLTPHEVERNLEKPDKPRTLDELLPGSKSIEDADFNELLWGGFPDAPVVNYGDDYVVTEGEPLAEGREHAKIDDVIAAVKTVEDPEIMLNVYDLGLIYRMDLLANADVEIDMTVTAAACPVAGLMPKQVAEAVSKVDGVGKVTVKLVWEPAWSLDRISEDAKYVLDMF